MCLRTTGVALLGLVLAGCEGPPSLDTAQRIDIGKDLWVRNIADGVFIVTHAFPWPANALVVEAGTSALVLVDTPYTPEATKALLGWMETRFGERRGQQSTNARFPEGASPSELPRGSCETAIRRPDAPVPAG